MGKAPKAPRQWLDENPQIMDWLQGYIKRNPCENLTRPWNNYEAMAHYLERSLESQDPSYLQRVKQAWRVHRSREGKNLRQVHLDLSKRELKALEALAKSGRYGRTSVSHVVAELVRWALKGERTREAAIKRAKQELKQQTLNQQRSDLPQFIPLVTAKEAQELKTTIGAKNQEIADLKMQLSKLRGTLPADSPDSKPDSEESQTIKRVINPFKDQKSSF